MTGMEPDIRPISAVWPPKNYVREQPPSFFTRVPEADKTVSWPPRSEHELPPSYGATHDPSQTVHLRDNLPVKQEQAPVYQAAPVVTSAPRSRGGHQWPPEGYSEHAHHTAPGRIPTPKLSRKQCPATFQGRPLPANYTGYRAAPGVLHMSPDAARYIVETGVSDF